MLSYVDVLLHGKPVGKRVAMVGAGGIGFDVAEFLVHDGHSPTLDLRGVAGGVGRGRSGAGARRRRGSEARRRRRAQVYLLQRKASKLGEGLGKTTGWIHRAALKMKRVRDDRRA